MFLQAVAACLIANFVSVGFYYGYAYREWPEGVLLEGVQHFEKNKIQGVTAC